MDFEKIYKELMKVIGEKNGVVIHTQIKKKEKKEVKKDAIVQSSN